MEIKKISQKVIKGTDVITFTTVMVIVLVLMNFFGTLFFKRFDLTANQKYSLSPVTKNKLKNLDDLVNIKAYFSKQLPPRFLSVKQEVTDFLKDYQSFSKGKLKITYIDPLIDQKYQKEALSYGVPQLQFSDIEKDKFQVQNGFLGLVVLYEDRYETLPVIENIQNLEYDLTSAILKVLTKTKKNVALVNFSEQKATELTPSPNEYTFLGKFLEKQYQVSPLSLKNEKEIDKNINTLIIIGDKDKASDYEKYRIDQYVMSGKGVLFLINGVSVNEGLSGSPANHNLFDLLESYGVKVNSDLVLDSYSDIASFQSGYNTFLTPYLFWPKIVKTGFSAKNPITAKLETLTLHWPSSITLIKDKQTGANYEILIKSSKKSWTTSEIYNLSPQQKLNPSESELKENNLAVLVTGKLTSFYAGKDLPKPENQDLEVLKSSPPVIKETKKARMIIVSNANFVKDNFLSRGEEGLIFFLNSLDYLNSETELMQIRSKSLSEKPLPELSDNLKQFIRWGNVIAPIILVLITYVIRKIVENNKDREIVETLVTSNI